ncbi:SET domain-containing protein SmydA-8 [Culex quinquefasciatus]|uniref:SET domain-containing protein SmydA-8 n=1 Tax=Culex quinquefasciatus TaxID=7176 RepID=UPI0018E2D209|nr:SET domain-containing protein SmydA-8 [Culex quinquefasciatus]
MSPNHKKKKQRKQKNQHQPHGSDEPQESVGDNGETGQKSPPEEELNNNKPYVVRHSDVWGRYLIASRNLKAGEVIIQVEPLAVGPWAESDPVCLGCHRTFEVGAKTVRCPTCNWRICSPTCTGLTTQHSRLECIPLKEHGVAKLLETCSSATQIKLAYEAILALRCLLLKRTAPDRYEKLLEMDAMNERRQQITSLWKRNQETIVQRIRDEWKFEEFSEAEVHTVCGIIEVNAFQIGPTEVHARALYPEAFYIMHDCTPNTTHTDQPGSHELTVRPTRDLKAGEPLTLSYSYTLQGTLKRRQHLCDSKFFWCQCPRCVDPTEFGTHCSTLKCAKCPKGLVLSSNPLDQDAPWKCKNCPHTIPAQSVTQLLNGLYKELESIGGNNVELFENFLLKYEPILHKNHYLFLSAKHSLCELYGKAPNYLMHELTLDQINRKEYLCRDLLTLADSYEPGLSRLRGQLMYELQAPIMVKSRYLFETQSITLSQLKQTLKEVARLLKQSAEILGFEPPGSADHEMAVAARNALREMGG